MRVCTIQSPVRPSVPGSSQRPIGTPASAEAKRAAEKAPLNAARDQPNSAPNGTMKTAKL